MLPETDVQLTQGHGIDYRDMCMISLRTGTCLKRPGVSDLAVAHNVRHRQPQRSNLLPGCLAPYTSTVSVKAHRCHTHYNV